jgi:Low psii accumulation1 / Rep27
MAKDDTEIPQVEKSKSTQMDPALRTRLLAETIAPWRTVRLFLYGSLGSGAALGGFITLTGVLAGLSGARSDLDLNTEVCSKLYLIC